MIGLLVMAYGGPNNLDEVEPYLMDVRGHRPTSPEIVREVRERYREIGGRSPILEQTQAQASALEAALNKNGQQFKAFVGMRHSIQKGHDRLPCHPKTHECLSKLGNGNHQWP